MVAGIDFPVTQDIGGNWNNFFWEGSFSVNYTETEIGSRFDYEYFLTDGNIGVTDFEMVFGDNDFSYGFNLYDPGDFVWSIEVPYTGYQPFQRRSTTMRSLICYDLQFLLLFQHPHLSRCGSQDLGDAVVQIVDYISDGKYDYLKSMMW